MKEFDLIDQIIKKEAASVDLSIGDDCSAVSFNDEEYLITTTDLLVEGVHFKLDSTSFEDLGYKTLAVNISDIAAMGGTPCWAHLSLALPKNIDEKDVQKFFKGFYGLADQYDIHLIGGDISASPSDFFINLALSGKVMKKNMKKRSDFKAGEKLYVTGQLGESAAGLKLLEKGEKESPLVRYHLCPPIHLEKAQTLSLSNQVQGMMDVSDGLLSDLQRAAKASGCGFDIELDHIPLSSELRNICEKEDWNPLELALAGGEDYCLLFSASADFSDDKSFCIGTVTAQSIRYLKKGEEKKLNFKAFSHF